jgi:hypothetical protein
VRFNFQQVGLVWRLRHAQNHAIDHPAYVTPKVNLLLPVPHVEASALEVSHYEILFPLASTKEPPHAPAEFLSHCPPE